MRGSRVVAMVVAGFLTARVGGAEHLVAPDQIEAALQHAREKRAADLAAVEAFLSGAQATQAARMLHVDPEDVRARAGRLSDAELADVAARADALRADPVAGAGGAVVWWTLGVLAAAFVILLIITIVVCLATNSCTA